MRELKGATPAAGSARRRNARFPPSACLRRSGRLGCRWSRGRGDAPVTGLAEAEGASDAMDKYLLEKLKMKEINRLGICETKPERFITSSEDLITPSVGILVKITSLVTCKLPQSSSCQLNASVSFAEPFSLHFENITRELVDNILEELELCVMLLEAWPGEGQVLKVSYVEIVFRMLKDYHVIAKSKHAISFTFFTDFIWRDWDDDKSCEKYSALKKHLVTYKILCLDLIRYQSSVKEEPATREADEYWKTYCAIFCKCRKQCSLFPVRVKDFSVDTPFQQHDNLNTALGSWYSRDHAVIFPGEYEAVNLSLLTRDIMIGPVGTAENEQSIVSRLLHLASVLTRASLTVTDHEITGAQGSAVELYTRSTAILETYKIHHCTSTRTSETPHHSQGGINVKVVPEPKLEKKNNRIFRNGGTE
ncbi:PREDICTED: SHC SH2 domain-binding protein 1-like protein [Haliaeetus leucocephalus]|uniref:SHC SH2 domain-binding protein 1-like protein n=1 Tax=Haliaeetus leucocephalus TaxID=52644 RepID=UPI00053CB4D8|nr:PREDICTED: SHC SH2 domain-binding protein 1-like protein [Haliaeetus leucocephalus]